MRAFAKRNPDLVLGLLVLGVALATRLPDLGAGTNVDAVLYWFGRTRKFWEALGEGRFADTYYSPHPGVSIMWLSGAAMKATGTLNGALTEQTVISATAPITILASIAAGVTVPLLYRVLGAEAVTAPSARREPFDAPLGSKMALAIASLTGAFLATEPFVVAHARNFHLDATASSFLWLGILLSALTLVERRAGWAVAAGACLGVAMLTRLLSVTFIVGIVVASLAVFALEGRRSLRLPVLIVVLGVATIVTVFALWPALWVEPIDAFRSVLGQSNRTADRGHRGFSWGEVTERDPGALFYAGVMLMRSSPEMLALVLLGLGTAWFWPKRSRAVLAAFACVHFLPALVLFTSNKKADRYTLLFFPFLLFLGVTGLVVLFTRLPLPSRIAARRVALAAGLLALLFTARLARLARVHPVHIAWCASYPGLRCENVIMLGNGEGFREAALWIKRNSPVTNPNVLSAYAGGIVMRPWLRFQKPRDGKDAHFVVTYLSTDQRGIEQGGRRFAVGKPIHEVELDGRTYVRIFRGPAHPNAERRRRRAD